MPVIPRKWQIERIEGVPESTVNPPPAIAARIEREQARSVPGTPARRRSRRFRIELHVAAEGTGERRVRQPAHLQRHSQIPALRPRRRRGQGHAGPCAGRRHHFVRQPRSVPDRRHRAGRSRPWTELELPAPEPYRCSGRRTGGTWPGDRPGRRHRTRHRSAHALGTELVRRARRSPVAGRARQGSWRCLEQTQHHHDDRKRRPAPARPTAARPSGFPG